jgi:universal stress protein A
MKTNTIKPTRGANSPGGRKRSRTTQSEPVARGKLRRILVPVDFSLDSKKALRKAFEIGKDHQSSLVVLHVMDSIYRPGRLESPPLRQLKREAHEQSTRALAELVTGQIGNEAKVKQLVRTGVPYAEIVALAEKEKVDLIAIGSRGHTGLKRFLLGSTAERVVRLSRCPVLVVR